MNLKLIFIDIDNTLLDFDAYTEEALKSGFKKFRLNYSSDVLDVFHEENNALWKKLEKGEITFEKLKEIRFQNVFNHLKIDFDGKEFESYYRDNLTESAIPVNHAHEMLKYLNNKYLLAAASNGPYLQQLHRLSLANMDSYFSYFFISEKLGFSKPSTNFFKLAFDEINKNNSFPISPNESCIIGDSLSSDIQGGKNYRMKTCYFDKHHNKTIVDSDYVLEDLLDVKKFF